MNDSQSASFSQKLNRLFDHVRPQGGGQYTNDEVARGIRSSGVGISSSYIWLLRRGDRDNPTMKHVEALASFFGVPASYFVTDDGQADAQMTLAATMRDASVQRIAFRASGLSAASLDSLVDVIQRVRELEGLPPNPGEDEPSSAPTSAPPSS